MKITANGISMNYQLEGPANAPVVTLSHSLATNLSMWDPQIAALTPRYRVLRYDTRGHGGTEAPEGPYTLDQLAEDVRALLQVLKIARTHFIGLSMGGFIGQILGLKYPKMLGSLILCDTTSRVAPEAKPTWDERIRVARTQGMEPHVEPTISRWFTAPFREKRPEVVEPVRAMIRATPVNGFIGCAAALADHDYASTVAGVKHPVLFLVGEKDAPAPAMRKLKEKLAGSRYVELAGAGHISNMDRPAEFTRAVAEFLAA